MKKMGGNARGFKVRINQHISDHKRGVSTCKFQCHVHNYGIQNNWRQEPFLSLNIMLRFSIWKAMIQWTIPVEINGQYNWSNFN